MGSFGERMQREREMRGITLEEIAESTKIGTRSLRALEQEDFDKLPGGIFNKGFVRAYAKYLGIDEEQAVTDFMAAYGDFQLQLPVAQEPQPLPGEEPEPPSFNVMGVAAALALVVVIGCAWYFNEPIKGAASHVVHRLRGAPSQTQAAAPQAPVTAPATPEASPAVGTTAAPPADTAKQVAPPVPTTLGAQATSVPGEFVLQIRARQDSWVSIIADDKLLMEGVLKGDKTVHAKDKVVFKTGNASAVEVSFNGEVQPPLGADNQVKTVVFTAAGMQR